MINLESNPKIYFIGIGGIAMSATAGISRQLGYEVLGSDSKELYDPAKSVLTSLGINYSVGYDAKHVVDLGNCIFIASAGEDLANPEVKYLYDNKIPIYSLSELLYELSKDKIRIVVAGTHGKSTTTAILGKTLQEIDNSSFMTGAVLLDENQNFYLGDGHYFTFEGDEYKALFDDPTPKFQQYKADIAVLTNLEFDHPDVFSSIDEVKDEFREMLDLMPSDGVIVYNADSVELVRLAHESNLGQVSYALDNKADFVATNLVTNIDGTAFDVLKTDLTTKAETTEHYTISAFGRINVYNALATIATLRTLGFSAEQVSEGLQEFKGLKRRFEYIGEKNGISVFDDYAHHPTAVSETLNLAKLRFPDKRIWVVFEPHTFSRTQAVLSELSKSFEAADQVLLAEIYPAREKANATTITGQQVVSEIAKHHKNVRLVSDKSQAKSIIQQEAKPGDVVVIMAVGNFNTLAKELCS